MSRKKLLSLVIHSMIFCFYYSWHLYTWIRIFVWIFHLLACKYIKCKVMQWSVILVYLLFRWRNSESWRSEEKYKTFCQDAPPPTMKRTTMFVTPDNKKQRWEWPCATLRAHDSALCSLISPSRSSVKLGFPTTRRTSICVTPDNKKQGWYEPAKPQESLTLSLLLY